METFGQYQLQRARAGRHGRRMRAFDTVLQRIVALKLVLSPGTRSGDAERFFRRRAPPAFSPTRTSSPSTIWASTRARRTRDGVWRRICSAGWRGRADESRPPARSAFEICRVWRRTPRRRPSRHQARQHLRDGRGGAKILDFGLARLITSAAHEEQHAMGTLNYMAPEQVRGERADHRSDVFSVGVVLYELLGGRKAFEGDSVASTLYKILQVEPEPLWKIDPALPRELTAIVERALAKLRDERYPDMSDLRRDLDAFRQFHHMSGPTTPRPSFVSGPFSAGRPSSGASAQVPERSAELAGVPGSGAGAQPLSGNPTRRLGRNPAIAAPRILVVPGGWFVANAFATAPHRDRDAPAERPEDPLPSGFARHSRRSRRISRRVDRRGPSSSRRRRMPTRSESRGGASGRSQGAGARLRHLGVVRRARRSRPPEEHWRSRPITRRRAASSTRRPLERMVPMLKRRTGA